MTASWPRTRTGRPRLRCTDDVLYCWAERIEQRSPDREWFEYSSMIARGDSLFHYGTHFELARIIRNKRGDARLVLCNGDTYAGSGGFGPSTASRQSDVRRVVALSNVPHLVVPFSALEGAGIDFDTIQPIHVRDDRFTYEDHSSRKQPTRDLAQMPDPNGRTTVEKRWRYIDGKHEYVDETVPVYVDNPNQTRPFSSGHGWCEGGATRDEDGVWHWTVRRHWLGDSLFRARSTDRRTRKATPEELAAEETHQVWAREHRRLESIVRSLREKAWDLDDGSRRSYRVSTYGGDYRTMTRHLFHAQGFHERADEAQAAVRAHEREDGRWQTQVRNGRVPTTVTRWATFLSSFDYQESTPLYFLCELPYRARPNTVDEAIEALKPPEVVAALARGLAVVRQGDLFAIPTKLTKRQIRRLRGRGDFTKRLRVLGTNHSVTEGIVLKGGAVLGRGVMRHEPEGWRAPDHANQKLGDGKTWHLLVRNTVPRSH